MCESSFTFVSFAAGFLVAVLVGILIHFVTKPKDDWPGMG
jgi:hypothetical protein